MNMKRIYNYIILLSVFLTFSFKGDKMGYKLYNSEGKEISYKELYKVVSDADVVFFGEQHNNAIAHWLQYELTKDLIEDKKGKVVLGAEMFEADNQLIIDEFLSKQITEKKFEEECRLWPNYATDYKPLMTLALENKVSFIATNIPRRYASMVHKGGFESLDGLSKEAKKYIAPLPIFYDAEQDAYKSMMTMGGMQGHANENLPKSQAIKDATMAHFIGHANENLPKSQAIKDATMAHFINENLKSNHVFIHYNGAYHSDKYQGIVYYLNRLNKKLKVVTITTISVTDVSTISKDDQALANFIISVDENMTSTQ